MKSHGTLLKSALILLTLAACSNGTGNTACSNGTGSTACSNGTGSRDNQRKTYTAATQESRWTAEKANGWYEGIDWPVGCDYVPAYAGNQLQMWHDWDPEAIGAELALAQDLGFNSVRVFLHHKLWQEERDTFFARIDEFLSIADKHGITTLMTIFTNGGSEERSIGEDISPLPGIHNSIWAQTPGISIVNDPSRWGMVEEYEKDVLTRFGKDRRIIAWCLYNEPENVPAVHTLPLLKELFRWAREAAPSQPLTATIVTNPFTRKVKYWERFPIITFCCENCDILSYHCYDSPSDHKDFLSMLQPFGRPIFCTEYLARTRGSIFRTTLPVLKENRVAAYNFGLVNGATQCHYEWNKVEDGKKIPFESEPELWFHDIFRQDFTPYDTDEVNWLKDFLKKK